MPMFSHLRLIRVCRANRREGQPALGAFRLRSAFSLSSFGALPAQFKIHVLRACRDKAAGCTKRHVFVITPMKSSCLKSQTLRGFTRLTFAE